MLTVHQQLLKQIIPRQKRRQARTFPELSRVVPVESADFWGS